LWPLPCEAGPSYSPSSWNPRFLEPEWCGALFCTPWALGRGRAAAPMAPVAGFGGGGAPGRYDLYAIAWKTSSRKVFGSVARKNQAVSTPSSFHFLRLELLQRVSHSNSDGPSVKKSGISASQSVRTDAASPSCFSRAMT
jgi:hypothetical protein